MQIPHVRRRWVVLLIVVLVAVGTLRLLDQPLTLESYRVVDPTTVIVSGHGTRAAWTHITGVAETEATVTISVNSLEFTGFLPHTDQADGIDVEVRLGAPLGGRAIIDGSTGQPVVEAS